MDAVLEYCKKKDLEPESVTRLISKSLKDKIEANARDLNYLPNQAKLPIQFMSQSIDIYLTYCAMKAHFGKGDYDFVKFNGKTQVLRESFWKR